MERNGSLCDSARLRDVKVVFQAIDGKVQYGRRSLRIQRMLNRVRLEFQEHRLGRVAVFISSIRGDWSSAHPLTSGVLLWRPDARRNSRDYRYERIVGIYAFPFTSHCVAVIVESLPLIEQNYTTLCSE